LSTGELSVGPVNAGINESGSKFNKEIDILSSNSEGSHKTSKSVKLSPKK